MGLGQYGGMQQVFPQGVTIVGIPQYAMSFNEHGMPQLLDAGTGGSGSQALPNSMMQANDLNNALSNLQYSLAAQYADK